MARPLGSHDAAATALLQAVLGLVAGGLILAREPRFAGLALAGAAASGLWATRLVEPSGSARAGFAAEAAERLLDAAALAPIAWVSLGSAPATAVAALTGLGTGAVAAYQRSRGRSLGFSLPRWPAYRAARTMAVAAGLLLANVLPLMLLAVAADCVVMAARWWLVAREAV